MMTYVAPSFSSASRSYVAPSFSSASRSYVERSLSCAICILLIFIFLHDRGDTIAAATQRGTISGRVVTGVGDGRPVRLARVFLTRADGPGGATEISDDDGRFAFTNLPAGRYLLGADKAGFVKMNYGETRPGRPGSAIAINDGQQLTDLTLRMIPGGVITGTVFDQAGNGASDVAVFVFRARPSGPGSRAWVDPSQKGERTLLEVNSSKTDDRGVYRFYGLTPGEYLVGARPTFQFGYISAVETTTADVERSRTAKPPTAPEGSRRPRPVGYAGVYYPGTADSASAGRVVVTAGQERSGIDIALQLIPLSSVEGRITWPGNQPKDQRAMVMIVPLSHSPWLADVEFDAAVGGDLTFAFRQVVPGRYSILAQTMTEHDSSPQTGNAPPQLSAVHELDVSGDVSGLVLALQPMASMSGRIITEAGTAVTQLDRSRLSLMLWPATTRSTVMSPVSATIDAEGTFTITGISPGTYRLLIRSLSSDPTIVSSAIVNGANVLDDPVEIKSGDRFSDVVVTLTDQPTELSGAIQDRAGRPASEHHIVVFPVNRARWFHGSRYIQAGRPASDGRYVFRGLPPGDYFMAALTDVEDGEWFDAAFLDALMPAAIKISLGAHEKKVQDIRVGG